MGLIHPYLTEKNHEFFDQHKKEIGEDSISGMINKILNEIRDRGYYINKKKLTADFIMAMEADCRNIMKQNGA